MDRRFKEASKTIAVKPLILISFIALSFVIVAACRTNKERKIELHWEDVFIHADITKIKNIEKHHSIYVYANLLITGKDRILHKADLTCIQLKFNDRVSKELYIDSVADILTEDYEAKANKLEVRVYWVFNEDIDENSHDTFEIVIQSDEGQVCFEYQNIGTSEIPLKGNE